MSIKILSIKELIKKQRKDDATFNIEMTAEGNDNYSFEEKIVGSGRNLTILLATVMEKDKTVYKIIKLALKAYEKDKKNKKKSKK